jgi:Glycosyltransferase family 20
LRGVLHSNLIGFQTYSYARHFISSCTRVLGLESSPKGVDFNGSSVAVNIFPAGIDVEQLIKSSSTASVAEKLASYREMFGPNVKKIIQREANPRGRVPVWYTDLASSLSKIPISDLHTHGQYLKRRFNPTWQRSPFDTPSSILFRESHYQIETCVFPDSKRQT